MEHKAYEVFEQDGLYWFFGKKYPEQERVRFGPYIDRDRAEWESGEAEAMEC